VGEHPKYSFSKDEIVVVLADNQDRFWIAQVTDMDDEEISLRYFHFTYNSNITKDISCMTPPEIMAFRIFYVVFLQKRKFLQKMEKFEKLA
jgi:hypothetical protein